MGMSGSASFQRVRKVFVGGERPNAGGIGIRALRGSRLQAHSRELRPDEPTLPSSSSRQYRCGRESSETRRRLRCPVRLPGTPRRERKSDRDRKCWRRTRFVRTRWASRLQHSEGGSRILSVQRQLSPESQEATATASGYPAGSVSLKSCASDSARAVSPAMANASAASLSTP